MTARRPALGRGLEALIPSTPAPASDAASARPHPSAAPDAAEVSEPGGTYEVRVDEIQPNPDQPRRRFATEQLASLSDSIARHGLLQPLVVRRAGDHYELVVGERRWRAARAAGLERVPVVVADVAADDRLELAIVENVQRHDLNPIELAHAYHELSDRGLTQEQIGERVGLDRSSVANHLRLLDLSRDMQADVEEGRLSAGHAKAVLQVPSPERRRHLRDRILRDGLSVREAEALARSWAEPSARRKSRPRKTGASDPELAPLVDQLRRRLQTRVRIQGDRARGRIEIEYFGREDLDRLAGLLAGEGA